MLFNSIEFSLFLPIVFVGYWFIFKTRAQQNFFILIASYVFYGWWDWRFLSLIAFSSFLDYLLSNRIEKSKNKSGKRILLLLSILVNIGFLSVFKYYNFFAQSFKEAFSLFGFHADIHILNIILPVGISFYTFQTLSYTIDVYKGKLTASKDIVAFFAFVSFFPQLVAGPIERAANLLPQFLKERTFNYQKAVDGCRQILWGLFKKIVVADNCAPHVNEIFSDPSGFSSSTLFLGAVLFAFQIYGDFSGYSDIAIGTSRLFGFDLKRNFAFPYFSRNIGEFWRRWHISLSTWFRDYMYIPLGGSQGGVGMKIRNTFIIFLVSGFWHGANWTFLVWGGLNALYFIPLMLAKTNRNHLDTVASGKIFPNAREFLLIISTFCLTVVAWIFFRAPSVMEALDYLSRMFSWGLFAMPEIWPYKALFCVVVLVIVEWLQRDKQHGLEFENIHIPKLTRYLIYYSIILAIFLIGGMQEQFIYFQF